MRYGNTELIVEIDSITVHNRAHMVTHHFIDTNRNISKSLGRGPTVINCTLFLLSESDALLLEQLMNTHEERDLVIGNKLYTRVVPGEDNSFNPIIQLRDEKWRMDVTFVALDPVPKNINTEGELY